VGRIAAKARRTIVTAPERVNVPGPGSPGGFVAARDLTCLQVRKAPLAVFAVFPGNYQRAIILFSQKPSDFCSTMPLSLAVIAPVIPLFFAVIVFSLRHCPLNQQLS
jgi:hypothetical protein